LIFGITMVLNCNSGKTPIQGETEWQKTMNANFKDASKSPLTDSDRKDFEGLDFFQFDSLYVVKAYLELTPDSEYFNMRTTTNEVTKERVYGIINFEIKGKKLNLKVYQGEENLNTPGLENHLFLPFLDHTNGEETYGGGRYIDLSIPATDSILIDFNKAYNPYCVYNENYSCPIVPRENYLDVRVEAGIQNYIKE